jgi:S-adenosylmethionine hydrolase
MDIKKRADPAPCRTGAERDITWKPERLSASFHGRDPLAPLAAMLASGESPPGVTSSLGLNRRPARRRLALPEKHREETRHGRRVVF